MKLDLNDWYKVLAPRPTVLVATVNGKGISNAAPFSFVMPVSMKPALVAFSSAPKRHTLANIRLIKDFTINIPGKELLNQVWKCAESFHEGVSEIKKSNLTEVKLDGIKSPGIKECYAIFSCKLFKEISAGDHVLVIGEVVGAEIRADVFENKKFDSQAASPLMHIGGEEFSLPGEKLIAG
ncbi:MAG: flavin reductase family protein [bacterium]